MLKRIHERQVADLAQVIGLDAARIAVRVNNFYVVGWVSLVLIALPFGLWAELDSAVVAWLPTVAGTVLGAILFALGTVLDRKSARLASDYVTEQLGYRVQLQAKGWRPSLWREAIEKKRVQHEASSSAR